MSVDLTPVKASPLFESLTAGELAAVAELFQEIPMAEGKTVFIENMPGESLYLIKQGTITISRMLAEGDEKTLVILGAEDLFGEMAVIDGAPREATARVAENAVLLCIKKVVFDQFCEDHPAIAMKLMRNVVQVFTRRVRETNNEYRDMLLWALQESA